MQFMASRTQRVSEEGLNATCVHVAKQVCKNSCLLTELRFNIQSYSVLSTSKNASTYYYFICTESRLNSGMPVSKLRTISPQDFLVQVLLVSHTQFKQEKKKSKPFFFSLHPSDKAPKGKNKTSKSLIYRCVSCHRLNVFLCNCKLGAAEEKQRSTEALEILLR